MTQNVVDWVVEKLQNGNELEVIDRKPEDILHLRNGEGYEFLVAVLGVRNVIRRSDVSPFFAGSVRPEFVVNVPSKTLWSGDAIRFIHDADAAFGALGDVSRAAKNGNAGAYRNKNMGFFIDAIRQHSNVAEISYVYDRVLKAEQKNGNSLTVAVIDAYNMSAEDVRHAKDLYGHFDVIVKSSNHGSITYQAESAAKSIGAEALNFGELMKRLAK